MYRDHCWLHYQFCVVILYFVLHSIWQFTLHCYHLLWKRYAIIQQLIPQSSSSFVLENDDHCCLVLHTQTPAKKSYLKWTWKFLELHLKIKTKSCLINYKHHFNTKLSLAQNVILKWGSLLEERASTVGIFCLNNLKLLSEHTHNRIFNYS